MDDFLLNIGVKLRARRRELKLSQLTVAQGAGISKGMLSKVETARTVPSLPLLMRLLKELDVKPDEFFKGVELDQPPPYHHQRADEAHELEREVASNGFHYLQLMQSAAKDFAIRAVLLTIEPHSLRERVSTDAYEYKYILEGEIEYEIGEDTIILRKGDSLFYDGRIPHVPHNRTLKEAKLFVLYFYDNLMKTV